MIELPPLPSPKMRRAALGGLSWIVLSLLLVGGQAAAQTSVTGLNRDSVRQLNLEKNSSREPSIPSAQRRAKWHTRANVCRGNCQRKLAVSPKQAAKVLKEALRSLQHGLGEALGRMGGSL